MSRLRYYCVGKVDQGLKSCWLFLLCKEIRFVLLHLTVNVKFITRVNHQNGKSYIRIHENCRQYLIILILFSMNWFFGCKRQRLNNLYTLVVDDRFFNNISSSNVIHFHIENSLTQTEIKISKEKPGKLKKPAAPFVFPSSKCFYRLHCNPNV